MSYRVDHEARMGRGAGGPLASCRVGRPGTAGTSHFMSRALDFGNGGCAAGALQMSARRSRCALPFAADKASTASRAVAVAPDGLRHPDAVYRNAC